MLDQNYYAVILCDKRNIVAAAAVYRDGIQVKRLDIVLREWRCVAVAKGAQLQKVLGNFETSPKHAVAVLVF